MPEHGGRHLRTQFVFIDTQAFRRARVDWSGRSLSRLVELAQQGQLRLIVTGVTTREVRSQLRELLAEANASLSKHSGLLQQLGVSSTIERVRDQSTALGTLEAAFDQFLQDTRAINVQLISDLTGVLDDYFTQRPPFSKKRNLSFPMPYQSPPFAFGASRTARQPTLSPKIVISKHAVPNPGRFSMLSPSTI